MPLVAVLTTMVVLINTANAVAFQVLGWVFEADEEPYVYGVGAPAVVYDPAADLLVMFFEYKVGSDDTANCGSVGYRIGRATSPDGMEWTVADTPVLVQQAGTYFECAAAQPSALLLDGTWHLWFTASQKLEPCPEDGTPSPWGCERNAGIGHATSNDGLVFQTDPEPALHLLAGETRHGASSVVQTGAGLHMLYEGDDGIFPAWSSDGVSWARLESPVLTPDRSIWGKEVGHVWEPTMTCSTSEGPTFEAFFAGFDEDNDTHQFTSFAHAWRHGDSDDGITWTTVVQADHEATTAEDEWRLMEVLRAGEGRVAWYSAIDYSELESGRSRIGLLSTVDEWTIQDLSGRNCPDVMPSEAWIGDEAAPGLWWCGTPPGRGAGPAWLALLPALLAGLRRRVRL